MNIPNLESIDVRGKRVLLRCDLNVPLKDGVITDDGRFNSVGSMRRTLFGGFILLYSPQSKGAV